MYQITTNNHRRPLLAAYELPAGVLAEYFDYVDDAEDGQPRFFQYRNWWYDTCDTPIAPNDMKALGWDGFASDSYGTGILTRWFNEEGEYTYDHIVAGYLVVS